MRLILAMVLAGLVASPLSVSAQADEEGTRSEPTPQDPAPSTEPALQLQLDDVGVEVAPSPPQKFNGYTLDELEVRKRRAGLALIAPAAATAAGIVLFVYGTSGDCWDDEQNDWDYTDACRRPRNAGMVLSITGGVAMIIGSVGYGRRARAFNRAARGDVPADSALPSRMQLQLEAARVEVAPSFTPEEMQLRAKRPRRALYVSLGMFAAGLTMGFVALANYESCGFIISLSECPEYPDWVAPVGWTGLLLAVAGLIGTTASAAVLARRRGRASHRPHWDLARSRLVF